MIDVINFIVNVCKILFIILLGILVYLIFFRGKKSNTKIVKKEIKTVKEEPKIKEIIKVEKKDDEDTILTLKPHGRYIKDEKELKKEIKLVYEIEFNIKEEYFEKEDRDIIKSVEKPVVESCTYNITHNNITNDEELHSFIEYKLIKEIEKKYEIDLKKIHKNERRKEIFKKLKETKTEVVRKEPLVLQKATVKEQTPKKNSKATITLSQVSPIMTIKLDNKWNNEESLTNIYNYINKDSQIYNEIMESNLDEIDSAFYVIEELTKQYDEQDAEVIKILEEKIKKIDEIKERKVGISEIKKEQENNDVKENNQPTDKPTKKDEPKKDEKKKDEPKKEKPDNEKKDKDDYDKIDFDSLDKKINGFIIALRKELEKEDLEDKNYEMLQIKIEFLKIKIKDLKRKKLKKSDMAKLDDCENKLLLLETELNQREQLDILNEKNDLNEEFIEDQLFSIEQQIYRLDYVHKSKLSEFGLNRVEDLNSLDPKKAKQIQKQLIKSRLDEANSSCKIPMIMNLPFLRNKYFAFLTSGLMVHKNLNYIDNILNKITTETDYDLSEIGRGKDALEGALNVNDININFAHNIEQKAYKECPELKHDLSFVIKMNQLKRNLVKRETKLLKKKKLIGKYKLLEMVKVRKLTRRKDIIKK